MLKILKTVDIAESILKNIKNLSVFEAATLVKTSNNRVEVGPSAHLDRMMRWWTRVKIIWKVRNSWMKCSSCIFSCWMFDSFDSLALPKTYVIQKVPNSAVNKLAVIVLSYALYRGYTSMDRLCPVWDFAINASEFHFQHDIFSGWDVKQRWNVGRSSTDYW